MKLCVHCGGDLVRDIKKLDLLEVDGHRFTAVVVSRRCNKCGVERSSGIDELDLLLAKRLSELGFRSGFAFSVMRKALGIPAVTLAELLDVAPETVSRWEHGKRPIDCATLATMNALINDALSNRTDTLDCLRALKKQPKISETINLDLTR